MLSLKPSFSSLPLSELTKYIVDFFIILLLSYLLVNNGFNFKKENADNEKADDISVIGQFGVGFYSSFMVADKVEVISKAFGEDIAHKWVSSGADGYTIEEC